MTITALVQRAQNGERSAFDALVARHQATAVALATRQLDGDRALAEDAAQDAFLEAYRDLSALRSPEAFGAWLGRIVRKQCDRRTRGKSTQRFAGAIPLDSAVAASLPSPTAQPEAEQEKRARREAVRRAVDALKPGEQVVVKLFYLGQHSHQEIAAFLGVPVSTVKSRLHSARSHLKGAMQEMETLEEVLPEPETNLSSARLEQIAHAKRGIQAAYDDFSAAYARQDPEGMIHWYAPDYSLIWRFDDTITPWDRDHTAAEIRKSFAMDWERPHSFSFLMERIQLPPADTETGNLPLEITLWIWCWFTSTNRSHTPTHRIDHWRETPEGWRLFRTDAISLPPHKRSRA